MQALPLLCSTPTTIDNQNSNSNNNSKSNSNQYHRDENKVLEEDFVTDIQEETQQAISTSE